MDAKVPDEVPSHPGPDPELATRKTREEPKATEKAGVLHRLTSVDLLTPAVSRLMTQIPQANAGLRTCKPGVPFRNWGIRLDPQSNLVSDNAV